MPLSFKERRAVLDFLAGKRLEPFVAEIVSARLSPFTNWLA